MYKLTEDLKDKIIECIESSFRISIPNNSGGIDYTCGYCYAEESEPGKIKHEPDCEGKDLIFQLNKLEDGGETEFENFRRGSNIRSLPKF